MRTTLMLALAVLLMPAPADAACADSTSETELATNTGLASAALSPAASDPHLGISYVAAGSNLYYLGTDDLATDQTISTTDDVQNAPNPVELDDGTYVVIVATSAGIVRAYNAKDGSAVWSRDLARSGCPNDSITAAPVIHLRRYASSAFRTAYDHDLVYVATRYASATGCSTGHNTDNQVFALNASDGTIEWRFNSAASVDMDVAVETPFIDIDNDKLIVATERTASTSQDSLWAIDVLTGTLSWSQNIGRMWTAPVVRGDQIYVGTLAGTVVSLELSDGSTNWSASVGSPIITNVHPEFRGSYDDAIIVVDYLGKVHHVRDDGTSATVVWTTVLPSSAKATSRIASDAGLGKLWIGGNAGQIYQLNTADGSIEADRTVSASSVTVGDSALVWDDTDGTGSKFDDIRIIAGDGAGTIKKFCFPWSTEVDYAPATATSAVAPSSTSTAAPCSSDADCGKPGECFTWACVDKVCRAMAAPEGNSCNDSDPDTKNDSCRSGTCAGLDMLTCELDGQWRECECSNGTTSVGRRLLVQQLSPVIAPDCEADPECSKFVNDEKLASTAGSDTSNLILSNTCLTQGSQAVSMVHFALYDEFRQPFVDPDFGTQNARLRIQLSLQESSAGGASGPAPQWVDLSTGTALTDPTVDTAKTPGAVRAAGRDGTYIAMLRAPADLSPASGSYQVSMNVGFQSGGTTCIDLTTTTLIADRTVAVGAPADPGEPAVAPSPGDCRLLGDTGAQGHLRLQVLDNKSGDPIKGATVIVGNVSSGKPLMSTRYASGSPKSSVAGYEGLDLFLGPPAISYDGSTQQLTDGFGFVKFHDQGWNLVGPVDAYIEADGYPGVLVQIKSQDQVIRLTP